MNAPNYKLIRIRIPQGKSWSLGSRRAESEYEEGWLTWHMATIVNGKNKKRKPGKELGRDVVKGEPQFPSSFPTPSSKLFHTQQLKLCISLLASCTWSCFLQSHLITWSHFLRFLKLKIRKSLKMMPTKSLLHSYRYPTIL